MLLEVEDRLRATETRSLHLARSLARGGPILQQEPVHLTLGLSF